jgi:hypothetical protein
MTANNHELCLSVGGNGKKAESSQMQAFSANSEQNSGPVIYR